MGKIVREKSEVLFNCEGCSKGLIEGDMVHQGDDGVWLCLSCAPTLQDMQDNYSLFADSDGLPLTEEAAAITVAARLADGMKLTDKMVSPL